MFFVLLVNATSFNSATSLCIISFFFGSYSSRAELFHYLFHTILSFGGSSSAARRILHVDVSSPFGIDRHRRAARQPAPGLLLNEKASTPITVWPRRKRRKCMPYHRPLMIRAASMEQCNARGCRTTIVGVPGVVFATPTGWQDGWCMIWGLF